MAESSVNVTEGSGKRLHTYDRTVSSVLVQDQVILHGHPLEATYTLRTSTVSVATAESHLFQIMAGSSLNVYVHRIQVFQHVAVTTAAFVSFALLRLTSAGTGGTTAALNVFDTSDATAGATAQVLPTSKGAESTCVWDSYAYMMQTVGASTPMPAPMLDVTFDSLRTKAIRIAAGTSNGLVLSNRTAAAGGSVSIVAFFTESSY